MSPTGSGSARSGGPRDARTERALGGPGFVGYLMAV